MEMSWLDFLAAYEINIARGGGADFAELVLRLINGGRWAGQLPAVGAVVQAMAKERGCTTQQLYSEMRRALAPIFDGDEAALRLWEFYPDKMTSSGLAVVIARRELERAAERGDPKPRKGVTSRRR